MIDPELKRQCRRKMESLLRQHKRPKHGWSGRKKQQRWEAFYDAAFAELLASEEHGQAMRAHLKLEDAIAKLVDEFVAEFIDD